MSPLRPAHFLILLLCALGLALSVGDRAAAAKISCGQQVLNDWADGRIDKSYPAHCYQEALRLAPQDTRVYSSLEADLARALQNAIGGVVPAGQVGNPVGVKFEKAVRETERSQTKKKNIHHQDDDVLAYQAANSIGPPGGGGGSGGGGLPLPLIVLAGVALVLLATGTFGMVSRRIQESRIQHPDSTS